MKKIWIITEQNEAFHINRIVLSETMPLDEFREGIVEMCQKYDK